MMDINKNGVEFNFLKNLDIVHINNDVGQLHAYAKKPPGLSSELV